MDREEGLDKKKWGLFVNDIDDHNLMNGPINTHLIMYVHTIRPKIV